MKVKLPEDTIGFETLSLLNQFNETIIFGLRTKNGISTKLLQKYKHKDKIESSLQKWKNYLEVYKETIRITPGNYHLADEISADMMVID